MTEPNPTRREKNRSSLVACAALSAISLALPAGIYLLVMMNASTRAGQTANVMAIVIAAVLGIAYATFVLAARDSGAAMIAGVSTTLGVVGVVLLVPILLLAKLDSMSGGHAMGPIVFGVLVYVAVQFTMAGAARSLAPTGQRVRASGGFQLGIGLPLGCALLLGALWRTPANAENEKAIADVHAREKTRADFFALYACATAHRARAARHDYPASLAALGAQGDKCLPAVIATGERGFTFEYTPRMSGADTVAGFTIRAAPKAAGPNATMLTMDEHAIIRDDWVDARYAPLYRPTPPGLDMLVAMRECEQLYRDHHHRAPSDLQTLRAFGDSTFNSVNPTGCWELRSLINRGEWFEYGQPRKQNEWTGAAYTLTFHSRGDSGAVAYEVRPKSWGVTGIWSYLALSPGAMYGTTEPRAATTDDVAIPICEFGAPPAGSPQCAPGNSPPPNATLVLDSVPDARGFTVALVDAADSASTPDSTAAGQPEGTAPEFQYAFSCDGMETNVFARDASHTCHPSWQADSVHIRGWIRNRDLTVREYDRSVHVKRPPIVMRLAAPKSVALGDTLDLHPTAVGRDSSEQFRLTVQIGDAFPMDLSNWPNGTTVKCTATTRPLSWECSYPAKPGTYRVTVTAKSWKGDTASVMGSVVMRRAKKPR
ncbi:MAG: hypothetical protein ACJ79K_07290 [Gemmatimonadaceae bacterium]